MTFADKYSKHAYADLIREAETQGIGLGVQAERERIINLIGDKFECIEHYNCEPKINITCSEMYALIKGDDK